MAMVCVNPPFEARALRLGLVVLILAPPAKPPWTTLSEIVIVPVPSLLISSLVSPQRMVLRITRLLLSVLRMASPPAVPDPFTLLLPLNVALLMVTLLAAILIIAPPPHGVVPRLS